MADRSSVLLILGLTGLINAGGLVSCSTGRSMRPDVFEPRINSDTESVVIQVVNYQPDDVAVFLEARGRLLRIGSVPGLHESLFVLPSDRMANLSDFTVVVGQMGHQVWRTDLLRRTPGKMARVYLWVGAHPGSSTSSRLTPA